MPKIELAVLDQDSAYLKAFVDFLSADYNYKFNICHFTKVDYLIKYLTANNCRVDISVIDFASYTDEILNYDVGEIVILTQGYHQLEDKTVKLVNKYQQGDKLISEILNCCSEASCINDFNNNNKKKTNVVAVYSPIGGSGKTCIAIGAAIRCINRGFKVFYLNLESASSVDLFFDCNKVHSISEVLYFLKEKGKNINNKIEALKSVDAITGIHFLSSPDRCFDYDEIEPEEYKHLIASIVEIGIYDFVFVDMPSDINKRVIPLLDICDNIILPALEDGLSNNKLEKFYNELKAVDGELYERVKGKITKVVNRASQYHSCMGDHNNAVDIKLPEIDTLISYKHNRASLNLNNEFGAALDKIISLTI